MLQENVPQKELQIMPMVKIHIPAVVNLHRRFLGYSINSRLGTSHLAYLYEVTSNDALSTVLVAAWRGEVAGVVSATIDPERLKRKLLTGLSLACWLKLILRLLLNPGVLLEWLHSKKLRLPVVYEGKSIIPCLTAIAVDTNFRKVGIGKALVLGVEDFLRINGYESYRLDTREGNLTSRQFYHRLGFLEVEHRGENVMCVKIL